MFSFCGLLRSAQRETLPDSSQLSGSTSGHRLFEKYLRYLREAHLSNSDSQTTISLNSGRHNFSSLAQDWQKVRNSSLKKLAKYQKRTVSPTRLEIVELGIGE